MRFWHKVVSTIVLAVVILLPFQSIAMCVPQDRASMQCPPECPMMAKIRMGHDGLEMKQSGVPGSCCQICNSKPAPVTESNTVVPFVSEEPVQTSSVRPSAAVDISPPSPVLSQAQLCTFLI